jgi:RNA polymerase-binding transcription factor DksA
MNQEKREYFRAKLLMHRDQMREMVQRNEEHGRQKENAGMDSADLAVRTRTPERRCRDG